MHCSDAKECGVSKSTVKNFRRIAEHWDTHKLGDLRGKMARIVVALGIIAGTVDRETGKPIAPTTRTRKVTFSKSKMSKLAVKMGIGVPIDELAKTVRRTVEIG